MGKQSRARRTARRAKERSLVVPSTPEARDRDRDGDGDGNGHGTEIIIRGGAIPDAGPQVVNLPGGKKAVVSPSGPTVMCCRWWRGGEATRTTLRHLGITQTQHPVTGVPMALENTLSRELRWGEFTAMLPVFGICDQGPSGNEKGVLACHIGMAVGASTTKCGNKSKCRLVDRSTDDNVTYALAMLKGLEERIMDTLRDKPALDQDKDIGPETGFTRKVN